MAPPPSQASWTQRISLHFQPTSDFTSLCATVQPQNSWGDPLQEPSSCHIRILFQNCDTFTNRDYYERFTYLNQIASLHPTVVGLSETNINWSHQSTRQSITDSIKARWPHRRLATAHTPNAVPLTTMSQAGGTLQFVTGRCSGRVLATGSNL